MNGPDAHRRHISQWQATTAGLRVVAVSPTAPHKHFPFSSKVSVTFVPFQDVRFSLAHMRVRLASFGCAEPGFRAGSRLIRRFPGLAALAFTFTRDLTDMRLRERPLAGWPIRHDGAGAFISVVLGRRRVCLDTGLEQFPD